ncbi:NLR family CARD domain-containing protein 3 [Geodia barretti]|uniref:NLR family CARD domain-containing protein 3 n=1 Tax=Geodia barretti TaxID=519541 RepID=A0AA35W911_GEOBA|nr:NLR family CARD domain-containing protein 3 [Geodia barretti]
MGALDLARALRGEPDLCTDINFQCVVYEDDDVPLYVEMVRDFPEMMEWDREIKGDVIVYISDEGVKHLAQVLEDSYEVTVLELSSLGIGNDAVKALARALDSNSTLKELDLSNNKIDCDGVNALAMALKDNITLEILKLNINKIGNDGAEALAEVLQSNSTLRTLNLSNNAISDDGIEAIARALYPEEPPDHVNDDRARASHRKDSSCNTALKELILSYNEVGDKGAMALSQALHRNSTLKGLTLYGNPGIGEEGVHHLIQALTVNVSIAGYSSGTGGLVLDKKNHERYAVNFPDYTTVKHRIALVILEYMNMKYFFAKTL